ncbi:hypothetical protein GCM10010446_33020 [Streptomyces enissocaesilis]|uniref:HTH luxR-type domain-containing protein n=1 Tax=Streptomyces enissocaesilis TaxID=332589 RepID=A0ABP6JUF9_9ACTN
MAALVASAMGSHLLEQAGPSEPCECIRPQYPFVPDRARMRSLSNDQIADRVVIGPLTAKTHIDRAAAEFHARERARLVALAHESGLVVPRSSWHLRSAVPR